MNDDTDKRDTNSLRIIIDYSPKLDRPFIQHTNRLPWKYARPATLDELKHYLLEEQK